MPNTRTENVKRAILIADQLWPFAQSASNMNKPDSDNLIGSAATSLKTLCAEIEQLEYEQYILSNAIIQAAEKCDLINSDAPLDGPHLLMILNDMSDFINLHLEK